MNSSTLLSRRMFWLAYSLDFFKKHFPQIFGLGLIAGTGRVVQLGGFGSVGKLENILLELVIEGARLFLVIYIIGLANPALGLSRIKNFFTKGEKRKEFFRSTGAGFKKNWKSTIVSIVGFSIIAFALNFLIDALAYQTCLFLTLRSNGILDPSASEWTILLFFKNLSVIPFTLVFQTMFFLWLSGSIPAKTS
jgi:hypothetical protein